VGRDSDLSKLAAVIRAGDRAGVVLVGAAGVGKSRLAAECLAIAERNGLRTARVTATRSSAQLPFGALATLLPAEHDGNGGGADPSAFIRRCCVTLAAGAGGTRLVLFVDDAHLLDQASATLVHQLAETRSAFVVATVRAGETTPDAIVALWKDGVAERLDVGPLDRDAIEELLGVVLGGVVEPLAIARLAARCGGNVLFLRELVLGALAVGALREEGGFWRLSGPLTMSDRLGELIENRLGQLSSEERDFLELVALGEPLGAVELNALADPILAEALERQQLLRTELDGRRLKVSLAHPLYGELLRSTMGPLRQRTLLRPLADVVEGTGMRRRDDLLKVATWRLASGGTLAAEQMLRAARAARALYDFGLAERLIREGIGPAKSFDADLFLAELLFLQGRHAETEELLVGLEPRARDDRDAARVALLRIDSQEWAGRVEAATAVLSEAESKITDPAWLDALTSKRALVTFMAGHTAGAVGLLDPVLDRLSGHTLVEACYTAAFAYGLCGRTVDAVKAAERGLAAHPRLPLTYLTFYPAIHPTTQCRVLNWAGYLAESEALARRWYEAALAERQGDEPRSWFAVVLGECYRYQGRGVTATRWVGEAVNFIRPLGRNMYFRNVLIVLARAQATSGAIDEAEATVAEIDSLHAPSIRWEEAELLGARAWIAVGQGNLPAARRFLTEAAAVAAYSGELVHESAALHDLARIGQAADVATRLRELAGVVEGPLAPARAEHAEALASGDAAGLEAASAAFEALGALLLAAEAAADAAVAWRKLGNGPHVAAERRAATLAGRCEGATTPALQRIETRARLTKGERDVALLAAAGLNNKEIAESLVLSRGTVENYLHRTFQKLGISSRADLKDALDL
jgi:DNA-binding CsgD family transcriptional regulator